MSTVEAFYTALIVALIVGLLVAAIWMFEKKAPRA